MNLSASYEVQRTNQITGSRKWWAFATVLVTMFFSSLDQTVVSTAMPTVISDLHGLNLYTWVFTAYMITSSITVPIYGKLSDVFGRKPFYLFGLVMFGIGSAISGQAHSMLELVWARAVQGVGAGAMMSMPRATIGDIFSPKERARWMGVMMAVFGLSSIVGPAIGGFITDNWSWRWVFYVNLPFVVVAIVGVVFALPTVRTKDQVKVDWQGAALLTVGLVPILLALTWAGEQVSVGSLEIVGMLAGGALVLVAFVSWEMRAPDPLIAPWLFRNRVFTTSLVLQLLVGMAMFGSLMYLPIFVQGVIGLNAQNSGWIMTPMMGGFMVGSMVSGQVMSKTGRYRYVAWLSGAVIVMGSILLNRIDVHTSWPTIMVDMVVLGLGIGALMPLMNMAVQNAFPYRVMGTVNASQQFVSSLGGVVASPVFGTVLNHAFSNKLSASLPSALSAVKGKIGSLNPQALLTSQAQKAIAADFDRLGPAGQALYHQLMQAVKLSLTYGIQKLFFVGLIFSALTFIGTFFLPEVRLKGEEYFRAEENEAHEG
ncbi:MDR family MFS transporter [Alicyclobacillus acidocaldarius]|uniref:Drug resistance transporter, EmrB/QacA subfamily n=1 Tax=Alicyclobacillus acidocaldarius (strain Tc-4-1) TaxID=1048834 RepID=F8IER0_ALIAT|nr:MDR family MFS transporter [Alicyclobacillus acidocaldarius]AEJ43956.1 drug resistance transporter, EmrB/QacA subfamily [Alicyclobacillus acidocaldarius subsp. acidocaldarius Tc-4-1]